MSDLNRYITVLVFFLLAITNNSNCQVILETDYSDVSRSTVAMRSHFDIYNRISPINGYATPATANAKLCLVRPLGGKFKDGAANISEDTYLWDDVNKKFYTDFTLLKKQVDGVFNKKNGIYQIVLDNPSWAFQRDSLGSLIGGALKVATYGNAEPPRDFDAWANYLKEVMDFLVKTYGAEKMLQIQFGIGREIGTEGHWSGTKAQFFDFYKKSITAIHEVLPGAKIGSHFLWGSSTKSWAVDFVKWCKTNNVHYDFVGISYYPFYHQAARTNFTEVYNKDFGVVKDIPEWNQNAKFEIHEFALIESMASAGNSFVSATEKYQNSFIVGLMKMFYDNNMLNLFQWGTGTQYMPASTEILKMKGNIYYKSTKSGTQRSNGNYVGAIFTNDTINKQYNIMAYNYNASPTSNVFENLNIKATIDVPPGSVIKFRLATYNNTNNTLQWSDWQNANTVGTEAAKSSFSFDAQLPVFSFLKYEVVVTEIANPSSVATVFDAPQYSIYPNPVQNTLHVKGNNIASLRLNNITGVEFLNIDKQNQSINVSTLNKGFYVLNVVSTNGRISNLKFLKN